MRPSLAVTREPLGTSDVIPLSAAGREPVFFFGTLTDLDVLAHVLGRPLDLDDLEPATLDGHRRVRARDASYPLLIAAPFGAAAVPGLLLRRASRRDIARVNHFESGEYRAELRPVRALRDGTTRRAWLYVALEGLAPTDEAWDLEAWRALHKRDFFAACDGWMADCPSLADALDPRPPPGVELTPPGVGLI
jgi:hypothetical protein